MLLKGHEIASLIFYYNGAVKLNSRANIVRNLLLRKERENAEGSKLNRLPDKTPRSRKGTRGVSLSVRTKITAERKDTPFIKIVFDVFQV